MFVFVFLAAAAAHPTSASCGSASCFLVTHSDLGVETAGSFQVDLSFRYVDQTKKLQGSHSTDEVLVPGIDFESQTIEPDHHREISTRTTTLLLDLSYGVTSRVSVFGVLPLVVDKNHEHFDDVGTPDEHFTNTDGTRGFGDVAVGARYVFLVKANDLLVGGVSAKLPTGAYELLDSGGAINEPTIQPGTGSYDGLVSLYYVRHRFPKPVEWFVSGSARINGRNSLEYRVGDEYVASVGASYTASQRWVFSLQANARHAGRDDYRGSGVASTGSGAISLSPGVRFRTGDGGTEMYGYVQLPVYQDVNEAQLAPRSGFILGISKSF
ncbi:MAG TPA: hypothetical protein VMR65_05390 [Candidatus Sulfotelmatobacter sp.]|nr:hypothetical protein [Candidatus Sulfotelmatobacter sp.]